jgi:TonB family protein
LRPTRRPGQTASTRCGTSTSTTPAAARPERIAFTYKVDDHGNWIERSTYAIDEPTSARRLQAVEYRTITYETAGASVDCDGSKPQGDVVVKVLLGADGTVKDVRILSGQPCGLDAKAIEAAHKLVFTPAKDAAGRPVDSWVTLKLSFTKNETP